MSIIGKSYSALKQERLLGRFLSRKDIEKAKKIINIDELKNWETEIKKHELKILYYIAFALEEVGCINISADMFWFLYEKDNTDNFVIQSLLEKRKNVSYDSIKEELLSIYSTLKFTRNVI